MQNKKEVWISHPLCNLTQFVIIRKDLESLTNLMLKKWFYLNVTLVTK